MRQCTSILLGPGLILMLVQAGEINGEEGSQCRPPFSLWVVVEWGHKLDWACQCSWCEEEGTTPKPQNAAQGWRKRSAMIRFSRERREGM